MTFLISIFFNYISQFKWYLDSVIWLFIRLLEGVTGLIVGVIAIILAIGWVVLLGSAIILIICVVLSPKLIANYYDCGYYNFLFILSVPIGLFLAFCLTEYLENK
jgi:hypothetical protein